jgi:hypothetical protein
MRRTARRKLRDWTTDCLGICKSTVVVVTEVKCLERQCAPSEVLIAVFPQGAPRRQVSIHLPLAEIAQADVWRAWGADAVQGETP